MRGSLEPLIHAHPTRLYKKRFPHRFLPSVRRLHRCNQEANQKLYADALAENDDNHRHINQLGLV